METRPPPRPDWLNRDRRRLAPPTLDMTPEGEFRDAPVPPVATQIGRAAVIVAALAALGAAALLALWAALALIPIAAGAALLAWGAISWERWRNRRG